MKFNPYRTDGNGNYFTNCKGCKFAITDVESPHHADEVQTSCSLGRLKIFEDQGKLDSFQDGFALISRACTAYRTKEFEGDIYEQLKIKTEMILVIRDESNDKIKTALDKIVSMPLRPVKVNFLFLREAVNVGEIISLIRSVKEFDDSIEWKILPFSGGVAAGVNELSHGFKCPYYVVFELSYNWDISFLSKVNDLINKDLRQVSFIHTEDFPNGTFVQTVLHKHPAIDGWSSEEVVNPDTQEVRACSTIVDKVKFFAEQNNKQELIISWNTELPG